MSYDEIQVVLDGNADLATVERLSGLSFDSWLQTNKWGVRPHSLPLPEDMLAVGNAFSIFMQIYCVRMAVRRARQIKCCYEHDAACLMLTRKEQIERERIMTANGEFLAQRRALSRSG